MANNIDSKALLNSASVSALALGLLCVANMAAVYGLSLWTSAPAALSAAIKFILWAVKFVGCIWIMRYFMQRLASGYDDVTSGITLRQGVLSALFSALIVCAATLAEIRYVITPDAFASELEAAMGQMAGMLDSNSRKAIEDALPYFPTITCVSTFIYCFLYGTILAAILSRNIPRNDPFARFRTEDAQDGGGEAQE